MHRDKGEGKGKIFFSLVFFFLLFFCVAPFVAGVLQFIDEICKIEEMDCNKGEQGKGRFIYFRIFLIS